jgi:anhydro-N-acetylmuramic acid kinase
MNSRLIRLINKKEKIIAGVLSGTSMDGIDTVLVKIRRHGSYTNIRVLDFKTYPFPPEVKISILKNSQKETARIDEICRLNFLLGKLFSNSVIKLCRKAGIKLEQVDIIGSHGQTIHHLPDNKKYLSHSFKSTLQIGDPSVIANLTGIVTVGDFRVADCALGGDGAPLVPYLDYILFRSKTKNRALLNIGGISNITVLPKDCLKDDVIAFDTGPGNILIDSLTRKLFRIPYDKDSRIARSGRIYDKLFRFLKKDSYYRKALPKSTGREHYGDSFVNKILSLTKGINNEDILATVTLFTAYSIFYNFEMFIKPQIRLNEMLVSGGGSKNKLIMDLLKLYFDDIDIKPLKYKGIDVDNKEAVLFAVLANECISGITANMPNVTGSRRDIILGKICQ